MINKSKLLHTPSIKLLPINQIRMWEKKQPFFAYVQTVLCWLNLKNLSTGVAPDDTYKLEKEKVMKSYT